MCSRKKNDDNNIAVFSQRKREGEKGGEGVFPGDSTPQSRAKSRRKAE